LIGWGRNRTRRWVAIVLPGLLLRAMIPVGFMPMFGPHFSVQLALCEGYAPLPSMTMDMSADSSMAMPMRVPMHMPAPQHPGGKPTQGTGPISHQDHSSCPYGASPALAALPAFNATPITLRLPAQSPTNAPQVEHFAIAPRAQSPRGPPLKV
jgi:hypothetical protein